ncbi:uncharacterized protein KY384_001150 [Bacidia gigantensis]|uniref:uncharacterized protein n=1 Tax=Bacidia gigantensis TaxID=2732470 RepID=UPI001D04B259|nr:uncharacterized protein KY384_001150 [Bacidia gigantensis]KAG8534306.1 hypothetical protein KY384_001150 [Bacidia gigantensis]
MSQGAYYGLPTLPSLYSVRDNTSYQHPDKSLVSYTQTKGNSFLGDSEIHLPRYVHPHRPLAQADDRLSSDPSYLLPSQKFHNYNAPVNNYNAPVNNYYGPVNNYHSPVSPPAHASRKTEQEDVNPEQRELWLGSREAFESRSPSEVVNKRGPREAPQASGRSSIRLPSPRRDLEEYFMPGEGISREVLENNAAAFLGRGPSAESASYREQIEELIDESASFVKWKKKSRYNQDYADFKRHKAKRNRRDERDEDWNTEDDLWMRNGYSRTKVEVKRRVY